MTGASSKEPDRFAPDPDARLNAHFLTYANANVLFSRNADAYCAAASGVGFRSARHYTEDELRETSFWEENADTLGQKRGAGYWLWKPYIIREALRALPGNAILVYSDAGRGLDSHVTYFDRYPAYLLSLAMRLRKGFLFGISTNWMVQARFTKPDCLHLMDAAGEDMMNAPQLQATWSIWRPTPAAFAFLDTWLEYCRDPRILTDTTGNTDQPMHEDYQEHRHDQAIGSILAHRLHAHYLALHKPVYKFLLNDIRRALPVSTDFYKRLPNLETFLRQLFEDAAAEGRSADAVIKELVANAHDDEPIADMSQTRANGYPLLRLRRYIDKVQCRHLDEIDWQDVWTAMRADTKTAVKELCKGLKRSALDHLRAEIVEEHRQRLMRLDTRDYDQKLAKSLLASTIQPRLRDQGVIVPANLWSDLWAHLSWKTGFEVRNLFANIPKPDVEAFRLEAGTAFRERREACPEANAFATATALAEEMLSQVYQNSDPDGHFARWQRLWAGFSPEQQHHWMRLCRGKQMHIVHIYEEEILDAYRTNADAAQAFEAGCAAVKGLEL